MGYSLVNRFSLGLFPFMSAAKEKNYNVALRPMVLVKTKQLWLVLVFSMPTETLKKHDPFS